MMWSTFIVKYLSAATFLMEKVRHVHRWSDRDGSKQ